MFTRQQLLADITLQWDLPLLAIDLMEFDHPCFSGGEQSISITRGYKSVFDSPTLFWTQSLLAQEFFEPIRMVLDYCNRADFKPERERDFYWTVEEYSRSLQGALPAFLSRSHGFISSLRMHSDWNCISTIAEFRDFYVVFAWNTTA